MIYYLMLSDPVADMLTRIRNASAVFKPEVVIPFSKQKKAIAEILVKEGYLKKLKVNPLAGGEKLKVRKIKNLVLELKYKSKKPVIKGRPNRRNCHVWARLVVIRLPRTLSGFGITVISTSKGLIVDRQARKRKLGGEVICKVW